MSSKFRLEETEVAGSGHNFIGIAGEALTNRQLVRIGVTGTLLSADASVATTLPAIGITLAAATLGQSVPVLLKGWVGLSTWTWTPGGRLYVSDTAGALTQTAGTVTQEVGVASSSTQIWFDPQGLDTSDGAAVVHYKRWQEPIGDNTFSGASASIVARVYLRPFQIQFPLTLDRVGFFVNTANGNGRVAIYADNGDTPAGGALIVESASIALVLGVQEVTIATTALVGGLYWFALQFDDATSTISSPVATSLLDANATLRHYYYDRAGGYGAFTDPCPAVAEQSTTRNVFGRVASVP